MPQRRWISRSILLVASLSAAAALTACGSESDPAPTGSSGSTTSKAGGPSGSATTSKAAPGPLEVSDDAAKQLCDMMRPELSNWRVQGPTVGRIGLNFMVQEWALRNGGINGRVLADKPVIDRITTKSCPDVHQQAIEALELSDLAAGIAF